MPTDSAPTIPQTILSVKNLTKYYGDFKAVDGISFDLKQGQIVALLGGNGAGKTTTISMLLGLVTPTSGTIDIFGADMLLNRYAALPRMSFSSPYVDLPARLTVRQNLLTFGRLYNVPDLRERIAEITDDLRLGGFIDRRYGRLSSGQKTRVSVAKALLHKPDLILLDEPTASLDPDTADWLRGYLQNYCAARRATIVLASHNMAEVERMCDHVYMLKSGQIVDQGSPAALIEKHGRQNLEEVFLTIARQGPKMDDIDDAA